MSLWDVDKTGSKRISSQLNQNDQVMQRFAASTTSLNPVTEDTPTVYNTNTPGSFRLIATDTFTIENSDFSSGAGAYLTHVATYTIPHPDVIAPIVFVYVENALGDRIPLPYYNFSLSTGALVYQITPLTGDVSTVVEIRATFALSPGVPFRYYICQQTSAPS